MTLAAADKEIRNPVEQAHSSLPSVLAVSDTGYISRDELFLTGLRHRDQERPERPDSVGSGGLGRSKLFHEVSLYALRRYIAIAV